MISKKLLILFLTILLSPISSFSQTIYQNSTGDSLVLITPSQLKTANLIFVEHNFLLKENALLKSEVSSLYELNDNLSLTNQLNNDKITEFDKRYRSQEKTMSDLNTTIEKYKKRQKASVVVEGCLIGGIVSLLAVIVVQK